MTTVTIHHEGEEHVFRFKNPVNMTVDPGLDIADNHSDSRYRERVGLAKANPEVVITEGDEDSLLSIALKES